MKSKRVKYDKSRVEYRLKVKEAKEGVNEQYILKALSKSCIRLCTPSSIPYVKGGLIK